MGGSVQLGNRHDITSQFSDVNDRIIDRGLPSGDTECLHTSLQHRNSSLKYRSGRIANAAVSETIDLEVKQSGTMLSRVEGVRHSLIYGHCNRFGRRISLIAAVNCNRLNSHHNLPSRQSPSFDWIGPLSAH